VITEWGVADWSCGGVCGGSMSNTWNEWSFVFQMDGDAGMEEHRTVIHILLSFGCAPSPLTGIDGGSVVGLLQGMVTPSYVVLSWWGLTTPPSDLVQARRLVGALCAVCRFL
jgi:hypothetical protein